MPLGRRVTTMSRFARKKSRPTEITVSASSTVSAGGGQIAPRAKLLGADISLRGPTTMATRLHSRRNGILFCPGRHHLPDPSARHCRASRRRAAGVLFLVRPQAPGIEHLQTAIFGFPLLERRRTNPVTAAHIRCHHGPLPAPSRANDLLFVEPAALHSVRLFCVGRLKAGPILAEHVRSSANIERADPVQSRKASGRFPANTLAHMATPLA